MVQVLFPSACYFHQSITINFDHGFGKSFRSFLRKIMSNATVNESVRILTREFFGVGTGIRMRRTIGITFKSNRWDGYNRACRKSSFEVIIFPFTFSEAKTPAVIVNHDGNVIRILKSSRAAIKGRIIEVPFRRSELPDELRKIVPILFVARAAALGSEVILIPPLKFSAWRQRHTTRRLAADQITTH